MLSAFAESENQTIKIYFVTDSKENVEVRLLDVLGKIVIRKSFFGEKGINLISLEGKALSHSIYYLSISNRKDVLKAKVCYFR